MSSADGRNTTYKLVILEHKKKEEEQKMSKEDKALSDLHKKEVRIEDKYYVFATTMKDSWIGGDPNRVAEFYKKRWGIETSYKCYEQLRPWTTSTSYSVRILLWFFPFVLYNLWIIACFITTRQQITVNRNRLPCPLVLFVSMILYPLKVEAKSGRPPD